MWNRVRWCVRVITHTNRRNRCRARHRPIMRLREDASIWVKCLLAVLMLAFFYLTFPTIPKVLMEVSIYNNAPHQPRPETKQTRLVYVMHGSQRYVTSEDESKWISS